MKKTAAKAAVFILTAAAMTVAITLAMPALQQTPYARMLLGVLVGLSACAVADMVVGRG